MNGVRHGGSTTFETGLTAVAISLICLDVWLTFPTLLFSEEEGTRNGKEEERKRREG